VVADILATALVSSDLLKMPIAFQKVLINHCQKCQRLPNFEGKKSAMKFEQENFSSE
jgi:hypothetical protein